MTTEVVVEKLCNIAPIVADVVDNLKNEEQFINWIKDYSKARQSKVDSTISVLKITPFFVRKCDKEFYEILAILNDKTVEEVKAQDFSKTVEDVKSILSNEVLRSFFTSFGVTKTTETSILEG